MNARSIFVVTCRIGYSLARAKQTLLTLEASSISRMKSRLPVLIQLCTLVVFTAWMAPPVAVAQNSPSPEAPRLPDGPWLGTGYVEGQVEYERSGITGAWQIGLDGTFYLQVEDGDVSGVVEIDGTGAGVVYHNGTPFTQGTHQFSGRGVVDSTYTAWQDEYSFGFKGRFVEQTRATVRGRMPANRDNTMPLTLTVRVTEASCTDARGDWLLSWEIMVEHYDKAPQLRGAFVATRQIEAVQQEIEEYFNFARDAVTETAPEIPRFEQPEGTVGEVPSVAREIVENYVNQVRRFNRHMVDEWDPASEYSRQRARTLAHATWTVFNQLRQDECTAVLFGEELLHTMEHRLGDIYRNTVYRLLEHEVALTGREIAMLLRQGEQLPGVFDPPAEGTQAGATSDEVELGLQQQAERLLQGEIPPPKLSVDGEPTLDVSSLSSDALDLLEAAAERGWSFELYGERYWADHLLEQAAGG